MIVTFVQQLHVLRRKILPQFVYHPGKNGSFAHFSSLTLYSIEKDASRVVIRRNRAKLGLSVRAPRPGIILIWGLRSKSNIIGSDVRNM